MASLDIKIRIGMVFSRPFKRVVIPPGAIARLNRNFVS